MTKAIKCLMVYLFIMNIFGVALAEPATKYHLSKLTSGSFHIENVVTQTITVKYAICDQNYQNCRPTVSQPIGYDNVFAKSCSPDSTIILSSAISKDGKLILPNSCQTICSGVFRIYQPTGQMTLSCQTS